MTADRLAEFAAAPQALLDRYPNGGPLLQIAIVDLATTSAAVMAPLEEAMRHATMRQSASVGAGLAQAVRLCRGKDDALASLVQRAALSSSNDAVRRAFLDRTEGVDVDLSAKPSPGTAPRPRSPLTLDPGSRKLPNPFAPLRVD
jgi:hypothetical protein